MMTDNTTPDPFASTRAKMAEDGRKARILTIGTELTIVLMKEILHPIESTLLMARVAGEIEGGIEQINMIMSTALSVTGNVCNLIGEILAEMRPTLQMQYLQVLPKLAAELRDGVQAGDIKIMNSAGELVDGELAKEMEEMFRDRFRETKP